MEKNKEHENIGKEKTNHNTDKIIHENKIIKILFPVQIKEHGINHISKILMNER